MNPFVVMATTSMPEIHYGAVSFSVMVALTLFMTKPPLRGGS
jgi:hypothetical protein